MASNLSKMHVNVLCMNVNAPSHCQHLAKRRRVELLNVGTSHYGCRYVRVKGKKCDLVCTGTNPQTQNQKYISFNASQYTQEELWSKRHNYELEKSPYTVLCLDYQMAGVGSNSCGPALYQKYRIQLPCVTGQLNICFITGGSK